MVQGVKPFAIGETFQFESSTLKEHRTINVYLPLDYHPDSVQTYPVIYLLDGSADEDFIHVSGLVQFGSFPWINQLPPSIVVGISNIDRRRDFTFPTRNSKDKANNPTSGSSSKFIQFLETELQPLVKERYKTNGTKTIIGQSLGGLLATEILFKKPDMFDHYIIVSPSLWWDDESLLNLKPEINGKPESIFIAVGKEGKVMERTARSLFEKLKALNQPKVYFQYFPKQDHGDMLHLAVYAAFEKLF
ncbi:MAG: alpha/beta hydrolase [Saprospiraceae bacterium]|nr:alpha/beta hydrolase [Saprospiraceae bacterium]